MGTIIFSEGSTFSWDVTVVEAEAAGLARSGPAAAGGMVPALPIRTRQERCREVLQGLPSAYRNCRWCPHECEKDRTKTLGRCKAGISATCFFCDPIVSEEAMLSPTFGVFFQGCNLSCVYCHAAPKMNSPQFGRPYGPEATAARINSDRTCRTLSFIGGNPDNNILAAVETILHLEKEIPVVWNSNLFVHQDSLDFLKGLVDIFLPDLKAHTDCSGKLCGEERYFSVVSGNIRHLLTTQPEALTIIRHLVLPGHLECCTQPILAWIREHAPKVRVNLMTGYYPWHQALGARELNRVLTEEEIRQAQSVAAKLGVKVLA